MEGVILGTVQGITEWLPVSSEGVIVLVEQHFFNNYSLTEVLKIALFLHLGTVCAAAIYFHKDVKSILCNFFAYGRASKQEKAKIHFYLVATAVSGVIGFSIFKAVESFEHIFEITGDAVNIVIALLLFVTVYLQFKKKSDGGFTENDLSLKDGLILGVVQGCAALPGVSRSGSTTGVLLLRKYKEADALKISFLMSIPIVLAGNVVLNLDDFLFTKEALAGFVMSFLFGILTIHILLRVARKVAWGWFVGAFAVLLIISTLL